MAKHQPPDLDMTLEGEFVTPSKPPLTSRIMLWLLVIAVVAGMLSLAAFALWLALLVLPVALGAAAIAYGLFRYRLWREQRTLGQSRGIWRP
jgi:membrane protein implicated in regulation of membrane protease activity